MLSDCKKGGLYKFYIQRPKAAWPTTFSAVFLEVILEKTLCVLYYRDETVGRPQRGVRCIPASWIVEKPIYMNLQFQLDDDYPDDDKITEKKS
jgi:hypothetical protein